MSELHTNAYIREWLRACGPASCGDYNRAHGLTGKPSHAIGQRMSIMCKAGVLTRHGEGGPGKPFVYAVARDVLTPAEAIKVAQRVKAANCAARAPKVKREPAPRIPKPRPIKPEQVTVKKRRTVVRDLLSPSQSDMRLAADDKSWLQDSEAFIRANPDRYQVLPMDAPWSSAETLGVSHRKTIQGVA